jgi:uncharacterized protein YjgD (DUF1641 family)
MKLARQAITAAAADPQALATADQVFDTSIKQVRVYIDDAFVLEEIEEAVKETEAVLHKAEDQITRQMLEENLKDLKDRMEKLKGRQVPKNIKDVEDRTAKAIAAQRKDAQELTSLLEILRSQIAIIKATSRVIDDWLSMDVTVSKEQFDRLEKAYDEAVKALKGKQ